MGNSQLDGGGCQARGSGLVCGAPDYQCQQRRTGPTRRDPLLLSAAQWEALPAGALVYDIVYRPRLTRLRRDAEQHGCRSEGGLGMLAHQAALAFRRWTGAEVSAGVLIEAAQAELGRSA
ncbi:hypothetical protein [Deinococcus radiophilus]|uniref:hypothetical protein n=1 Tax=Deinococcus radiophilus TaxID=32062 RepID=UPI003618099D